MKRWVLGLISVALVAGVLVGIVPQRASAQNTQNFTITDFTADYYFGRTEEKVPTMEVNELIMAHFPQANQNHGIVRAIPMDYKGQPLDIQIQSITDATGTAYPYSTNRQNGNLVLKIGDPDRYVAGDMVYSINYTLKNQISFWPDHDEFYWDINGTQWQQPFGWVTARVHVPESLADNLQEQQLCYAGVQGSTGQRCAISRQTEPDGTVIITTTANRLARGETLTLVLTFDQGTFAIDQAARIAKILRVLIFAIPLILIPLVSSIFIIRTWHRYGRDAAGRGTIVPEYTPPKDFTVLTSDVLLQEHLRTVAISAAIVELAIQKYIAIYETEKKNFIGKKTTTYEVELHKIGTALTKEQIEVIELLFPSKKIGSRVKLESLQKTLYQKVAVLAKALPTRLFDQGYFRNDPGKVRNKYYAIGIGLVSVSFILAIGLFYLYWPLAGAALGLGVTGIVLIITGRHMPARSDKGIAIYEYLRGLEMYMKLAEAERLKYLQSPKGVKQWGKPNDPKTKIKLFEKLLPYAIIFGIEKDWAKEFNNIYTEPPEWYHGNWSTFNAIILVNAVSSFNTANTMTFASPSSSGTSGTGGGGFAGGGGGGGGGGGW